MNVKRESKLNNLDLFAEYLFFIKEVKEKLKSTEENIIIEKNAIQFPNYMGQIINLLV